MCVSLPSLEVAFFVDWRALLLLWIHSKLLLYVNVADVYEMLKQRFRKLYYRYFRVVTMPNKDADTEYSVMSSERRVLLFSKGGNKNAPLKYAGIQIKRTHLLPRCTVILPRPKG